MPRFTRAAIAKVLPSSALMEACQAQGLPAVTGLASRPDLVPAVWLHLTTLYPGIATA